MRRAALLVLALVGACTVGPDYERPSAPVPAAYKEAEGWKPAEPQDPSPRGDWWSIYQDPVLDGLEKQIEISNQTLKAAEAAYRQARAVLAEARAGYFPTATVTGSATRSGTGSGGRSGGTSGIAGATGGGGGRSTSISTIDLTADASWSVDLWGRIARTVESDVASAQASAADLANAQLSAQAQLATLYFELRTADEQKRLFDASIDAFTQSLQITQNQFAVGVAAPTDVVTAQTQLEQTRAQEIAVGVQRAQLEHAIAVLIGKPPAEFSLRPAKLADAIPVVPAGVPSSLLERRPDIAAAERQMAAANALIGVAIAAYFPSLTLSGSDGFASTLIDQLIKSPSNAWSFGGNLSETLFDFGARKYTVQEYRAAYDAAVASYRETVLTAFQQVEDELAALRILQQEYTVADETVQKANKVVELTLNEYKAGTVAYTSVVTVQITALSDALTLASIRSSRLVASVSLIQYLGGGWTVHELK
jgi:NodT family efflux transporter outer membrane factor (OMF) lipoprotein